MFVSESMCIPSNIARFSCATAFVASKGRFCIVQNLLRERFPLPPEGALGYGALATLKLYLRIVACKHLLRFVRFDGANDIKISTACKTDRRLNGQVGAQFVIPKLHSWQLSARHLGVV